MNEAIVIIGQAFWFMLPAYVANPSAVLTGGGTPMDLGKNFIDGKRILGDGKTWRGLIGGTCAGMILGLIQTLIVTVFKSSDWSFGSCPYFLVTIFCLAFGALLGDTIKSFVKRRLGIERGAKVPLMDSLDFVLGAWLLLILFSYSWFIGTFTKWHILVVLIITPFLHRGVNIAGYKLGKKKVPW